MIDLAHRHLSEEKTRALLRKLRDLNLSAGPIALSSSARVALAGCVSTDAPAESGVRYRLRLDDGRDGCLEIQARREGLDVRVYGAVERQLALSVTCDRQGRACARSVGARVAPETSDARALEHFLRRIVRAVFAPTSRAEAGC
jgi:hypothetical protein